MLSVGLRNTPAISAKVEALVLREYLSSGEKWVKKLYHHRFPFEFVKKPKLIDHVDY